MSVLVEVCIDSIGSLKVAERAGADRIELCSALRLGGLTASYGYMQLAVQQANIPIYAIIRPREGDFLYSSDEAEVMLKDIAMARQAGCAGVVIGALTAQGQLDLPLIDDMLAEAKGMGVTFHRAFDHCADPESALEALLARPAIERVLTSGQASSAEQGKEALKRWVEMTRQAALQIMPGAGVTPDNAVAILSHCGAREIHLSARMDQPSAMQHRAVATMGEGDDACYPMTNPAIIRQIKALSAHL
jgi:copper homeostasis protein